MLEKLKGIEINPEKFYNLGMWCFGIIAIANTASLIFNLTSGAEINILGLISAIASLAFNYLLFGFFYHLKTTMFAPKDLKKGELSDMENLLNEIDKKEVKK